VPDVASNLSVGGTGVIRSLCTNSTDCRKSKQTTGYSLAHPASLLGTQAAQSHGMKTVVSGMLVVLLLSPWMGGVSTLQGPGDGSPRRTIPKPPRLPPPYAVLEPVTDEVTFPNPTDSNSPAFWDGDDFYLFNSFGGIPRRSKGSSVFDATDIPDSTGLNSRYDNDVHSGRWMEAIVRDDDANRLYGWYHNEIWVSCTQGSRRYPQIGQAYSDDNGALWHDMGIILTEREGSISCDTENPETLGGVGDFSVILDGNVESSQHYLYFLFSQYGGDISEQGISAARMLWIDRDQPFNASSGQSQALKWYQGAWTERGIGGYSSPFPTFNDDEKVTWASLENNGYWGPSVHYNTFINKFVILMSRSKGGNYETEGVYYSFTDRLDDVERWSPPVKLFEGQNWYPQVIGDASMHGTDKLAGEKARFFDGGGYSRWNLVFHDPGRERSIRDSQ
jgi:hypothetical protein